MDELLPYALFTYRFTLLISTGKFSFRLLYGWDTQLPTELMMDPSPPRESVPLGDYYEVAI